jgi:hypothetical protein
VFQDPQLRESMGDRVSACELKLENLTPAPRRLGKAQLSRSEIQVFLVPVVSMTLV